MGKRKRSSLWGLVKKTNIHRYMGDRVSQYGRPRFCTAENTCAHMKSQEELGWKLTSQQKWTFERFLLFFFFFLLQPFDVTYMPILRRAWYRITSYQHSIYFLKITCCNCADECQQESTKTMRWKNLSASSPQHLLLLHIPVLFCWDRRLNIFSIPQKGQTMTTFS